jgi:hypothetical protein
MWSKFHLYWTGMNGSGNTGRTELATAEPTVNLDAALAATEYLLLSKQAGFGGRGRRTPSPRSRADHLAQSSAAWRKAQRHHQQHPDHEHESGSSRW